MPRVFKVLSLCSVAALLLTAGLVMAQEKDAAKDRAKAKGYLPPYYKDVIDGVQRDKIYKIQDAYDQQINDLEKQVKELRGKRDAEIAALLTPEQKKRMEELAAAAKVKKAADAKAKSSVKTETKADGAK